MKTEVKTKYGQLSICMLDERHAIVNSGSLRFEDIQVRCAVQLYCDPTGTWLFNEDTLCVNHVQSGAKLSGVVASRIACLVLNEVVLFLQNNVAILEQAFRFAQDKKITYILSEISKHENFITALKQQLEEAKSAKYSAT